jgi:protein-S-isoprenylcysteine O-methyltransferase Ste14
MEKKEKERPPFWFPVAPVLVVVFIYLILLFSGQIIKRIYLGESFGIPEWLKYTAGVPLILVGLIFFIWGFVQLKPAAAIGFAKRLRDNGACGLTRNPMYFGVNAVFLGSGIFLDKTVITGALIWSALNYLSVILWEEKQMLSKFGNEYIEYKKKVPRFIPVRIKRKNK